MKRVATSSRAAKSGSKKVIIEFPAALYAETQKAVEELTVKRSVLIRSAVSEYLKRLERRKLAQELAEGYRANAELNRRVAEDFAHLDSENL